MSFDVQVGQNRDPYLFIWMASAFVPEQTHSLTTLPILRVKFHQGMF